MLHVACCRYVGIGNFLDPGNDWGHQLTMACMPSVSLLPGR
jgi:hypothetical protein